MPSKSRRLRSKPGNDRPHERLFHDTRNPSPWCDLRVQPFCDDGPRPNAQGGEGSRLAHLRRQPGAAGILQSGRQGQLDRLRRRFLPRARGGDLRTMRPRSSSRRSPRRTASSRSRPARSTCCRATPPGRSRATSPMATSPASPITTVRASWCARHSRSIRRWSSTARRCARRPAPRPSSISPTSSAPTT